jgi:hypothetical protein
VSFFDTLYIFITNSSLPQASVAKGILFKVGFLIFFSFLLWKGAYFIIDGVRRALENRMDSKNVPFQRNVSTESLNQTLEKMKQEKYDKNLEQHVRQWLFEDLKLLPSNAKKSDSIPLQELLMDGTVLCK